jgi:hypothetical protein
MYAVFFHEDYDAAGGALDYYGTVDKLTEEALLKCIYQFIIDRIRNYRYHVEKDTALNYCATFNLSTLNLTTKECRISKLTIKNGGRYLSLAPCDGAVGWMLHEFHPVITPAISIREKLF